MTDDPVAEYMADFLIVQTSLSSREVVRAARTLTYRLVRMGPDQRAELLARRAAFEGWRERNRERRPA